MNKYTRFTIKFARGEWQNYGPSVIKLSDGTNEDYGYIKPFGIGYDNNTARYAWCVANIANIATNNIQVSLLPSGTAPTYNANNNPKYPVGYITIYTNKLITYSTDNNDWIEYTSSNWVTPYTKHFYLQKRMGDFCLWMDFITFSNSDKAIINVMCIASNPDTKIRNHPIVSCDFVYKGNKHIVYNESSALADGECIPYRLEEVSVGIFCNYPDVGFGSFDYVRLPAETDTTKKLAWVTDEINKLKVAQALTGKFNPNKYLWGLNKISPSGTGAQPDFGNIDKLSLAIIDSCNLELLKYACNDIEGEILRPRHHCETNASMVLSGVPGYPGRSKHTNWITYYEGLTNYRSTNADTLGKEDSSSYPYHPHFGVADTSHVSNNLLRTLAIINYCPLFYNELRFLEESYLAATHYDSTDWPAHGYPVSSSVGPDDHNPHQPRAPARLTATECHQISLITGNTLLNDRVTDRINAHKGPRGEGDPAKSAIGKPNNSGWIVLYAPDKVGGDKPNTWSFCPWQEAMYVGALDSWGKQPDYAEERGLRLFDSKWGPCWFYDRSINQWVIMYYAPFDGTGLSKHKNVRYAYDGLDRWAWQSLPAAIKAGVSIAKDILDKAIIQQQNSKEEVYDLATTWLQFPYPKKLSNNLIIDIVNTAETVSAIITSATYYTLNVVDTTNISEAIIKVLLGVTKVNKETLDTISMTEVISAVISAPSTRAKSINQNETPDSKHGFY